MTIFLAVVLAVSVKQDSVPLRSGCDAHAPEVITLAAGVPLKLLYSLAGEAVPCYKVTAEVDGKQLSGYLPATSIDGLDSFDKARRDAPRPEVGATPPARPVAATAGSGSQPSALQPKDGTAPLPSKGLRIEATNVVIDAKHLVETGHPKDALRMLEPELRKHPNAGLFALAGIAAWKDEENRQALEYWKQSLELQPDEELQALYARVEREVKHDVSNQKLYGVRVMLRYDGVTVPAETARQMASTVDETYARVSSELGCRTEDRIVTIVQSVDAYRKTTDAAEWSGGMFDGRIHMPAAENQQMDAKVQKALAHETTHACLQMLGKWPTWLHEGMAQKLSGQTLSEVSRAHLLEAARSAKLSSLSKLDGGWARMDSRNAALAYGLALAAVEALYENYGNDGVRNLMRNPERLPAMIVELNKQLGL